MITTIQIGKSRMRHLFAVTFCSAVSIIAGCGDAGLPRAGVAGQVTVKGRPLTSGRITFIPQEPTIGPATSASVKDGAYKLTAEEGPVVGKNRVQVEAELQLGFPIDDEAAYAKRGGKPLPPQPIPPQYNRQSTLVAEIAAGDDNKYDVIVP